MKEMNLLNFIESLGNFGFIAMYLDMEHHWVYIARIYMLSNPV